MAVMIRCIENEGTYERSHKTFFDLLYLKKKKTKLNGKTWTENIIVNSEGKEI